MGDVEWRSGMRLLQGEMQFGFIALQDHEADGDTVLEGFSEAEHPRVEVMGLVHIAYWQHGGNPPEADSVVGWVSHGNVSR